MRVRGPTAAAAAVGIEAVVVLETSTTTGTPPAWVTASSVATNVAAGTMHLVARLDPGAMQTESQRVEPTCDADAMLDAAIRGECLLERATCRPFVNAPLWRSSRDVVEHAAFSGPC